MNGDTKNFYVARFDGGKLHGQTQVVLAAKRYLSVPYFQYPGRHTHDILYKLESIDEDRLVYVPDNPHVMERHLR
jgi:hypothetical protein